MRVTCLLPACVQMHVECMPCDGTPLAIPQRAAKAPSARRTYVLRAQALERVLDKLTESTETTVETATRSSAVSEARIRSSPRRHFLTHTTTVVCGVRCVWRCVQLGTQLRERYFQPQCATRRCLQQLSHGQYDEADVLVRSSGLSRTLTSAQSVLAGLYPPNSTAASLQHGLPLGVQVRVGGAAHTTSQHRDDTHQTSHTHRTDSLECRQCVAYAHVQTRLYIPTGTVVCCYDCCLPSCVLHHVSSLKSPDATIQSEVACVACSSVLRRG